MLTLENCSYAFTVFEKDGFRIARYTAGNPITLPDGTQKTGFTAKGPCPTTKGVSYSLTGEFEKYNDSYTFALTSYEEMLPSEKDAIIAYLCTLEGVGRKLAKRLYESYPGNIFYILEHSPSDIAKIKGISEKKAADIGTSYARRNQYKDLFEYLFRYKISESAIFAFSQMHKEQSLAVIKDNPYSLMEIPGISFYAADRIARAEKIAADDIRRIKGGILEVLEEAESGGNLFGFSDRYPNFIYRKFLRKPIFDLLAANKVKTVTGSTFVRYPALYLKLLALLDTPVTEELFQRCLVSLKITGTIHLDKGDKAEDGIIFRKDTYAAEKDAAEKIRYLLSRKADVPEDLTERIDYAERMQSIRLSAEQREAVKNSLSTSLSVITGGPGTGKTSILKVLIDVYTKAFPEKNVVLCSPTGRAAKRMTESTGYPASTIHSLLGIRSDAAVYTHADIGSSLIIVDESSMIGAKLFNALLQSVGSKSQIVFVGDVDQLPSVEVGSCLRELIDCGCIPTVRLTQTFRQKDGSTISLNAARIKNGETKLEYASDFVLYEAENSQDIAERIADLYKKHVDVFGIDNVLVLTPFYKNTLTGARLLNERLRDIICPPIPGDLHIERGDVSYYEGNRIMFTKNTAELSNGDIGEIKKIIMAAGKPALVCDFEGCEIELTGDELNNIRLAYALTVHKAQGAEAPVCIFALDKAHSILAQRPLIYTAISRAKQKCILVGQEEVLTKGIMNQETEHRASILGQQINQK